MKKVVLYEIPQEKKLTEITEITEIGKYYDTVDNVEIAFNLIESARKNGKNLYAKVII